jgi:hypothetical protein
MNKNLKNVVYALFTGCFGGCFGGLLLPLVLKIPSESSAANVLKWTVSVMAIPGGFLGALVNGFKIHDIDFTIVDFGNFVFYFGFAFGFAYFLLRNAGKQQAKFSSIPSSPSRKS